jgi:hypothetical protein
MKPMNSARSMKKSHEVPWTFVASARDATPRRVLLVSADDVFSRGAKSKKAPRKVNVLHVGQRLEEAFIAAVRNVKRKAAKKA